MYCNCGKKMQKCGKFKEKQKWKCPVCGICITSGAKVHLTKEEVNVIIKLVHKGTSMEALAQVFGISRQAVLYHLKKNDVKQNSLTKNLTS